jgi:type I restriction enzyme S subunit
MSTSNNQATLERFTEKKNAQDANTHKFLNCTSEQAKIDDLAFIRKGTIDPRDFPEEEFELYSIPAYHTQGKPELKKGKEIGSSKVLVYPNDCLFGKLNPRVQKVWLVGASEGKRKIATTEFFPILSKQRPNGEKLLLPEFLFWILKSPNVQERIVHKVLGTTASRQRLSPSDILEEKIPCPPLDVQKHIVARIEQLMSRIDQVRKLREEALKDTEAVMQAALGQKFPKTGKKGWKWLKLSDVCSKIVGGGTPRKNNQRYFGGDIVWLTPTDLPPNGPIVEICDSRTKITKDGLKNSSAQLLPKGTILYSSRASIGKIAIAGISLTTNQGFANFVCNSEVVLNRFLAYILRWLTPDLQRLGRVTTFPEVKKSTLRLFEIPVPFKDDKPDLEEQKKILEYLDALQQRVIEIRKLQEETEKAMATLPKATLMMAFGEKL